MLLVDGVAAVGVAMTIVTITYNALCHIISSVPIFFNLSCFSRVTTNAPEVGSRRQIRQIHEPEAIMSCLSVSMWQYFWLDISTE